MSPVILDLPMLPLALLEANLTKTKKSIKNKFIKF